MNSGNTRVWKVRVELSAGRHVGKALQRERAVALPGGLNVDRQDSHPNEDAPGDKEQDQLHRTIFLGAEEVAEICAAAPYADEQVHRKYGQLVEEEQEEQVPAPINTPYTPAARASSSTKNSRVR